LFLKELTLYEVVDPTPLLRREGLSNPCLLQAGPLNPPFSFIKRTLGK